MLALDPKAPLTSSVEVNPGAPLVGIGTLDLAEFVSQPAWFDQMLWEMTAGTREYYNDEEVTQLPLLKLRYGIGVEKALTTLGFLQSGSAGTFKLLRKLRIVYPADANDPKRLQGTGRFPVVVLVHGNHAAWFGSYHVPNHIGYTYLQHDLAARGIVSVAVDQNAAHLLGSLIEMRARMVLSALNDLRDMDGDAGSRFHDRLDLDNVGLMGHSRGGDAVVRSAILNVELALGYGIRAVCPLAPSDITGTARPQKVNRLNSTHTDFFAVVYGALDGDICGLSQDGTGFGHYDRATTPKAMVFLDQCSHNRFNDSWTNDDLLTRSSDLVRLRSRADHRVLAREYIGGVFEWRLLGKGGPAKLFDGTAANSLGVPAAIQWSSGTELDEMESTGPRGGTRAAGTIEIMGDIPIAGTKVENRTNHQTGVAVLPPTSSQHSHAYQLDLAASYQNWTAYDLFTFRTCADADVSTPQTVGSSLVAGFDLVFEDLQGGSTSVAVASLRTTAPAWCPVYHEIDPTKLPVDYSDHDPKGGNDAPNRTVVCLETLAVELSTLAAAGVKLAKMKSVAVVVPPGFAAHQFLDSFRLVKR